MNANKFTRLNITFKLPESVAEKAISLSRKISKNNETIFVLDGIQFHPHITIYSPEYPEKNLDKVLEKVAEIASNTEKVNLVSKGISSDQGFISVEFNYTPELKEIHEESVLKLNSLREGHIREKYTADNYKMRFTLKQQESIKKYGYPDSMSLYFPHLTVIRLKDELLAKNISEQIRWDIPEFTADKIAVYKMGEHGTCRELVKKFNLK